MNYHTSYVYVVEYIMFYTLLIYKCKEKLLLMSQFEIFDAKNTHEIYLQLDMLNNSFFFFLLNT